MVIAHNMAAMLAAEQGNKSSGAATKAMKRLSSGRYINSAADNAAGLGVSQKMRAQINGMNRAVSNCQEGISLFQTLEKALKEANAMIERCKILADQSANGTYCDDVDREAMEQEYEQLLEEIDQISDTDFNGVCMLNGGEMHRAEQSNYLLNWEPGSVVNMTDYSNFSMSINPLSDFERYMDSKNPKIAAAMEAFNNSEIGVDIVDGKSSYYFKGGAPEGLSIETKGNKGIVYLNNNNKLVPIAEVTSRNTAVKYNSVGTGDWGSWTKELEVSPPKSISTSGANLNYPKKNSDEYDSDPNTNRNQALRTEYHDWIQSLPTGNIFKITDDRKHFTINDKYIKYFSIDDGNGNGNTISCDSTTEYDIGKTLIMTTDNSSCNTSGKSYKWSDATVKVDWDENNIRPGSYISLSVKDCSDVKSSATYYGTAVEDKWGDKKPPQYSITMCNLSGNCKDNDTSDFDSGVVSNDHGFWLEHGSYSFSLTYNTKLPDKRWTVKVSNDYGESRTYTQSNNSAEFDAIVKKFNLNTKRFDEDITKGQAIGGLVPTNASSFNGTVLIPIRDSYSFSFSFSGPNRGSSNTLFSNSYNNDFRNLPKYDPDNPTNGGIDFENAISGKYTYVNDDVINTQQAGYWVNSAGEKVDLKDCGIYLPSAYDYDVLPSAQYDANHKPLHNGMSITVTAKSAAVSGSGYAKVDIRKTEPELPEYDFRFTFAESIILQTNSRSKDAVEFTFEYSGRSLGDLKNDLNCSAEGLGLDKLTLLTAESANEAIDKLSYAQNKLCMIRSSFGSAQNRCEHKIDNLNNTNENLTAAESGIADTDMETEMIDFTKNKLKNQFSQAMLAQANQLPSAVMQMIGQ